MKTKNLSIKMLLLAGLFSLPMQAQVYMIGTPSTSASNVPFANGVSDDGKVIGLNTQKTNYIWTEETGVQPVGQLAGSGDFTSGAVHITRDGKRAVMHSADKPGGMNQIAIYNREDNTWDFLSSKSTDYNTGLTVPYGITPDADIIVGLGATKTYSYSRGIFWKKGNDNLQTVESIFPTKYFAVYGVSDDGRVMVGYQDNMSGLRSGSLWKDGVQTILTDSNNKTVPALQDVSRDGKWALGKHGIYAMKWSEETGMIDIVDPNASSSFTGLTTESNIDGSIILGYYKNPTLPNPGDGKAFIWTEKTGFKNLNEFVKELGFDDLGMRLAVPLKMSANGKHIVGVGVTSAGNVAFKVTLPDSFLATASTTTKAVDIKIYPNPVQDILKVDTAAKLAKYEIYDMSGKVISKNEFKSGNNSIDVSQLIKGTYILKVTVDGKEQSKSFIKK